MPRTAQRGGPKTRARIADAAAALFLERGFDGVTVAEIARAAGVSSVTVFNHFPRKEDLFLDRSADAEDLLRGAVRDRAPGIDVLSSLQRSAVDLAEQRHPLSGLDPASVSFLRTVADSPSLIGRAREIAADLQRTLEEELERDATFTGDAALIATLFIAGYASVLVRTARRRLEGEEPDALRDEHREHLDALFGLLRHGSAAG